MVNEENSNEHIEEVAKSEQSEVAKSDYDVVEKSFQESVKSGFDTLTEVVQSLAETQKSTLDTLGD